MWPTMFRKGLVVGFVVVACSGGSSITAPVEFGPGADTPVDAVSEVIGYLSTPDFDAAASLGIPGQAALASLAEGATFGQIAAAISSGDVDVASNFWAGFAQGAGGFLTETSTATDGGSVTQDGTEFSLVFVRLADGADRQVFTRDVDGFRVDIFASFAPGFADKMIGPVERLLSAQTDDARVILPALKEVVPSLLIATAQSDLPPQSIQAVLRLIELITRVS